MMQHLPTRAARRLALGFASVLALAGAARATDVVYPQLNTATTVQDTDLLATWRASGPLTKVQASVLESYIQGKLGSSFLSTANNLSELTSTAATARANLGLGSAALASTGTSGTSLCQLNANCTWTGTEAFTAPISVVTPNSGSSGAIQIRANAVSNVGFLQITDNGISTEWGHFQFNPNAGVSDTGPASWTGGAFTFTSGIIGSVTGNVTGNVSGAVSASTLSASGAVSGAGFSAYMAAPPSIGSTTPNSGAFTTLNASGATNLSGSMTVGGTSTFTGAAALNGGATGTTASFSGASSFGSTLGVTGLATLNGGVVASGGSLPGVDAQTPNNSTTGGLRIRGNATSGLAYLQITDSGASTEWGNFKFQAGAADTGPASWNGGAFTFNSGLTVTGTFTASVTNADLDTVMGAPGTCTASTTNICGFTVNAQGRITAANTASPHPAISGSTAGALETNNGSSVSWAMRASLFAYGCSSSGCTIGSSTNVSQLNRLAIGNYQLIFNNVLPSSNYTFICTAGAATAIALFCTEQSGSRSTGAINLFVVNGAGTAQDAIGSLNVLVIQN